MSASLPPRPSLEWLKKAAKKRLALLRRTRPDARLADAQLTVAREYGFPSWRRLKAHVEGGARRAEEEQDVVALFLRRAGSGAVDEVRAMLEAAPSLVDAVGPHPFWGGRPQALHVAIETGRRDVFDLLLEKGADVDGSNDEYDHWSPLMLAAKRAEMQAELLRRGAHVGLAEALMLEDDARVEELLRQGPLPETVPNGGSWLAFARTPAAIDRLLAAGAALDPRDRWGTTPVEAMSRLGARGAPLVRRMIERGAAPAPAEFARIGDVATLARLAEADPGIATLDAVMIAAVAARRHDLVAWLLERGANANARTDVRSRHTALHAAAWNGDLAMAKLLVVAGADPAARDEQYDATPEGWADTAIEVTNNPACAEVVEYLQGLGAS